MASPVGIFLLVLLSCKCEGSSDKDFSFSFLPEVEAEQQIPSNTLANTKQDKEGLKTDEVGSRGLQTQMLAEATKVEKAVRRLGLRSSVSQEQDMKHQGVLVSKAGALLLCSLFPDKSQLPEYCEGTNAIGKVREGVDSNQDSMKKSKDGNFSDQDVSDKEELGRNKELLSALEEEETTKPKVQFLQMGQLSTAVENYRPKNEQQQSYNNQGSNQLNLVPTWLRTLGFRSFLQPLQGQGQSYGIPVESYPTSSPLWYHNQPHVSPYQPYQQHLRVPLQQYPHLPLQHLQQPPQHLHLHLPESTQLPSTNPDCQPGNVFHIEGKKYFLCQSGSGAIEKEEGANSRQKRNSMLAWPFPNKVWSFALIFILLNFPS